MNSQEAITLLRNLEDALDSYCELNEEGKTAFRMAITALNCSEIPNRWIPCSERLPQSYVDVLVWFEYYRYGSYNRLYQTYGIGTYSENYESWTINHESGWHKLRVIAWMPFPEPYMEEDE